MKNCLIVLILALSLLAVSCTVIYKDKLGRIESYGYLVLRETKIYETEDGVKVVGILPKNYNFGLVKSEIEITNGLLHVRYDTGIPGKEYPDGWVKLNDLKVFNVWEFPVYDVTAQQAVSEDKFPIVGAKAREYIADFDKVQPEWSPEFKDAIFRGEVQIGMTQPMVLLALGVPTSVNKTKGSQVIEEQWIYSRERLKTYYVYFTNNKVVNMQVVGENVNKEE